MLHNVVKRRKERTKFALTEETGNSWVCGVPYTGEEARTYGGGGSMAVGDSHDLDLGALEPGSGTPLY
ncbi:MAG: hypothetical protein M3Z19_18825, partial [Chloroflexota bacterium]|nr:hypothetical protein [Chloroflexota bacterium]